MSAAISVIGGGILPRFVSTTHLASGVSGEVPAVVVQRETALVRSVDLRPRMAGDGDAWAVLLFGSAFFLVAIGLLIVWLRGRIRREPVPVRTKGRPLP